MIASEFDTDFASLSAAAAQAMRTRDYEAAVLLLEQVVALGPQPPGVWLNLAAARRASGSAETALQAVDEALRLEPRDFRALLMRASLLERIKGERTAAPIYGAALVQAPADERLDDTTRRAVAHAREVNGRYGSDLNAAMRASLGELALSHTAIKRAGLFVDLLTGRRRNYRQEPLGYFYPGLPAIEFWERSLFPWIEGLEDQTAAIREEMLAVGFEGPELTPYIDFADTEPVDQWRDLNRSSNWTAFHLYQHGRRFEANCARCGATLAALAPVDQPVATDRSPSSMFSVLKPHTRIPPHTGVSNTRLVCHLALAVPEGCGLRVGGETRAWREGEAWVFDDTIEHEAWNDSDSPRAVLLFDVWNPLIPQEEREAISCIMASMDAFNGAGRPSTSGVHPS